MSPEPIASLSTPAPTVDLVGDLSSVALRSLLEEFKLTEVLNEDPRTRSISLLGTLPHLITPPKDAPDTQEASIVEVQSILLLEKTHFELDELFIRNEPTRVGLALKKATELGQNDVYRWLLGWTGGAGEWEGKRKEPQADLKMTMIKPCTEVHIRKYSRQPSQMIRETPELYETVVKPYITHFPVSRIQWVYNILDKTTESERILYEDQDPETGFLILPDLKWDQKTLSTLYLLAIVHNRDIRSLRDLRPTPAHLSLLKKIRSSAEEVATQKYGLERARLRMFIHYQPSYYHFHVHITHVDNVGFQGITVGQAHLLDDVIDNLEQDVALTGSERGSFYERRTLIYGLGADHGLFGGLSAAQSGLA